MSGITPPYMGQVRPGTCALISLGNALLHFGLMDEPWDQNSAEFETLVDRAGCRHGSVIRELLADIEAEWPITVAVKAAKDIAEDGVDVEQSVGPWLRQSIDRGFVVALPIWDEKIGLHSCLVVDHVNHEYFGGAKGFSYLVINRYPFTEGVASRLVWKDLGFKPWNVPVVCYRKN